MVHIKASVVLSILEEHMDSYFSECAKSAADVTPRVLSHTCFLEDHFCSRFSSGVPNHTEGCGSCKQAGRDVLCRVRIKEQICG